MRPPEELMIHDSSQHATVRQSTRQSTPQLIDIPKEESIDSSPCDWENDYYNPIMAVHNATPEIRTAMFDEEYRREGILVYKFRPLKPEVQAQAEIDSLLAEDCGKGTRFSQIRTKMAMQEQWMDMHCKYPERTLQTFFRWLMEQTIFSYNNATVQDTSRGRPEFGKRAYDHYGTRRFHWEEKDGYGVYSDDYGHARDVDGHNIIVSKDDIRSLLERASMDEHNYLCLPEYARSFTKTKLVPEIYTKDEINEMFYGVCGEQEKNEALSSSNGVLLLSKLDLPKKVKSMVYHITRIQTQRAAEATAPASIDRNLSTSIDDNPPHSNPMKSQPDPYTRAEIDQFVEEIYRTLETTEEKFDRRCDDIYFPVDLIVSSLTSQTEAIQREIVEIQRYIAHRPEASTYRRKKISTDSRRRTSIDGATTRGRLVPKTILDLLVADSTKDTKADQPVNYVTLAENV
ncbi:hypothetical protein DY000_02006737 [Brassica cretica]|uniref:Uncharacterized protein n=1 Tax=Brassica cretica TaxID=69181 RepID=A0ABQ7C0A2_BRACR|nr:hypothetical protein DY000_02006737 [Brassica cretica]